MACPRSRCLWCKDWLWDRRQNRLFYSGGVCLRDNSCRYGTCLQLRRLQSGLLQATSYLLPLHLSQICLGFPPPRLVEELFLGNLERLCRTPYDPFLIAEVCAVWTFSWIGPCFSANYYLGSQQNFCLHYASARHLCALAHLMGTAVFLVVAMKRCVGCGD